MIDKELLKCAICGEPTEVLIYTTTCCCSATCAVKYTKKFGYPCQYIGPVSDNELKEGDS